MVPIRYNVRSLFVRKITTIATAVGIAMVVFVFAASLMLGEGVDKALGTGGRTDTVIVLRKGSDAELSSGINNDLLNLLIGRPEIVKPDGQTSGQMIGEFVMVITADRTDGSGVSNVLIRATPKGGVAFRPEIKIVEGKQPTPGTNEVMVGKSITDRFKGISLGGTFDLRRNRPVKVVGVFTADGASYESEVWGDLDVIRTSLGRSGVVSSARLRLVAPSQFDGYRAAMEADKRLGVKVMREADYFKKQSEQTQVFLKGFGIGVAILFSLAAMLGAAITMNGAVAHRNKEIGTLRALGFSRLSILFAFVLEAIMLAIIGGVIGLVFVMLLTFAKFPVMNFQTFSEIVISFRATPSVIVSALIFSTVMGLIGGLFPAIRAARVSPVEAMRG